MTAHVLAIDAGTTGVRGCVVEDTGRVLSDGYREFPTSFPRPGWVEQDPDDLWSAVLEACAVALREAGLAPGDVDCIGLTNQRETTVVWDRATMRPVHPAIVWQDRRGADQCEALRAAGHAEQIRRTTGLVVDAYFSATSLTWLLDSVDGVRDRAVAGDLAFGTVDTWIVACMTAGRAHVTEPSNASRTMLHDVRAGAWSPDMLDLFDVPPQLLPEIHDSVGTFATTDPEAFLGIRAPVTGIAGDQQAALFGQGAWTPGDSKNTYGTGSFLLFNTGTAPVDTDSGLLASVAWQIDGTPTFALEGSIFATGASVQWLRDQLGIIRTADETEALAAGLPDGNEGVYLVPAFSGLGAPHWDPHARATIVGLSRGADRRHLARAAIEAMAYQTVDVVDLMQDAAGLDVRELRVDGGAASNDLLCQLQADLLGVPVLRPANAETTVLGAAFLAGLGAGVWSSTDEVSRIWQLDRRFDPAMSASARARLMDGWHAAVHRTLSEPHVAADTITTIRQPQEQS